MTDWEIVGCAPTTDLRELKRAYAKALRLVPPEKDQAGFLRLREAYERLVARLEHSARTGARVEPVARDDDPDEDSEDDSDSGEWEEMPAEPDSGEDASRTNRWSRQEANQGGARPRRKIWSAHPLVDAQRYEQSVVESLWADFMGHWKVRDNWNDELLWKSFLSRPEFSDPQVAQAFENRMLRLMSGFFRSSAGMEQHQALRGALASAFGWNARRQELVERHGIDLVEALLRVDRSGGPSEGGRDKPSGRRSGVPVRLNPYVDQPRGTRSWSAWVVGALVGIVLVIVMPSRHQRHAAVRTDWSGIPVPANEDMSAPEKVVNGMMGVSGPVIDSGKARAMSEPWRKAALRTWNEPDLRRGLRMDARFRPGPLLGVRPGELDHMTFSLIEKPAEPKLLRVELVDYRWDSIPFPAKPEGMVRICPASDTQSQIVVWSHLRKAFPSRAEMKDTLAYLTWKVVPEGFQWIDPCEARPMCEGFSEAAYRKACPTETGP